ncbi:hypothetical protein GCM10017786_03370 [Amycolatopsis deserti]|uniref:Uncharacterized protein n=1 Tax=Amycolatopsis deserti TaxID=185696 RepID=A0ABQ3IFZ0_9PSEU|nr:hypothetical protein [Amycolatopsis deserti]GHE77340.1 hypothetical protein GCM10017786_03370 [Amycolatopsis deserti]
MTWIADVPAARAGVSCAGRPAVVSASMDAAASRPERLPEGAASIGDAAFVRYSPPPFVNAR